jgi:hypothetical protein
MFGISCRAAQYFSNQSFWGDESFLILNVRAKTASQLVGSLTTTYAGNEVSAQSAPPAYLISLKWLAGHMGETEFAYRLPALVMGCLALILMAGLAFAVLEPPAATVVVGMAAVCDHLIESSALVKQYSGDVATAALLIWLAVRGAKQSATARLATVTVAGAILVWWSEPIVFMTVGIALALLPQVLKENGESRGWGIWFACCIPGGVSFAAIYFLSMRYQQSPHLFEFWIDYFPDYRHPARIPVWLFKQIYGLFNYPYHPFGVIMLGLAVFGLVRRGMTQLAAICLLPIGLTLVAAMLHLYPFGGARVDFFLVPGVLLLAGMGLPSERPQRAVAAAAPMLLSGLIQAGFHLYQPRCDSHLRPALEFVKEHYQAGDTIVLTGGATWPVFYTYWPEPPGRVIVLSDRESVLVSGRFWCLCEFAPGEYLKKRKPNIDMVSAGAEPVAGNSYLGKGGVAMLYQR